MNKKGFTLVELLAVIVVLGIITGITVISVNSFYGKTKEKTEDVFISTITDALDMYLTYDATKLNYTSCSNKLNKSNGKTVSVEYVDIDMSTIVNSSYHPLTESDLVNPANKEVDCYSNLSNIKIRIYRDSDYVYYYSLNNYSESQYNFQCLIKNENNIITNLPIISNNDDGGNVYYNCNEMEDDLL